MRERVAIFGEHDGGLAHATQERRQSPQLCFASCRTARGRQQRREQPPLMRPIGEPQIAGHAGGSSAPTSSPVGSSNGSASCASFRSSASASVARRRSTDCASDHALENPRLCSTDSASERSPALARQLAAQRVAVAAEQRVHSELFGARADAHQMDAPTHAGADLCARPAKHDQRAVVYRAEAAQRANACASPLCGVAVSRSTYVACAESVSTAARRSESPATPCASSTITRSHPHASTAGSTSGRFT